MFQSQSPSTFQQLGATLFEKRILNYGRYRHPQQPTRIIDFTPEMGDEIITNFQNRVLDSTPLQWEHDERADEIIGGIIGLKQDNDPVLGPGLNAILSVSDPEAAAKFNAKLADGTPMIRGVSAGLQHHYHDTNADGTDRGTVLRHLAVVTHGWVKGMGDLRPLNLGDKEGDDTERYYLLSEASPPEGDDTVTVKPEDLLKSLQEMGYNVRNMEDLKDRLEASDKLTSLKDKPDTAITDVVTKLSDDLKIKDGQLTEMQTQVTKLSENVTQLSGKLATTEAEASVDRLIAEGKLTPAQKASHVKLFLSDKSLFDDMTKDLPVQVQLLSERGSTSTGEKPGDGLTNEKAQETVTSLADRHQDLFT